MVWKSFQIGRYSIQHNNDGEEEGGIVTSDKAFIACYSPEGNYIGNLRFTEVDKIRPPEINPVPDYQLVNMYFDIKRFSEVINTFRYEKPVYFQYDLTIEGNDWIIRNVKISAGNEPGGAQEGV